MPESDAGNVGRVDFPVLIEAAYRPGGTDADWLERIVTCAQPGLDRGRGLVGCLFVSGVGGTAPAVTTAVGVGTLPAHAERLAAAFLPTLAGRASGASAGTIGCCAGAAAAAAETGARECSAIVVTDGPPAARSGCALLAPLAGAGGLSREDIAVWLQVAQHLGAALQMRRAALHEQAVWRGLMSGRWTLIDHFDAGGRRFVVARGKPGSAARSPVGRLTDRERDVCARAAAGCANKVIAAELGVAVSTVGMLLLRATRKLRCTSREDLIRAVRFAEEPGQQNGKRPRSPARGGTTKAAASLGRGLKSGEPPGFLARRFFAGDEELVVASFPLPPTARGRSPRSPLTAAERDVMTALLDGRSYADIARRRRRSVSTVSKQAGSAFRKLGVSSRGELAARGILPGRDRDDPDRP